MKTIDNNNLIYPINFYWFPVIELNKNISKN